MWFRRTKKPTAKEVVAAVFDSVFTPEELKQMEYELDRTGTCVLVSPIKEIFSWIATDFKPRYSIEESIRLTREFIEPYRLDLADARQELCRFVFTELMKEIPRRQFLSLLFG